MRGHLFISNASVCNAVLERLRASRLAQRTTQSIKRAMQQLLGVLTEQLATLDQTHAKT